MWRSEGVGSTPSVLSETNLGTQNFLFLYLTHVTLLTPTQTWLRGCINYYCYTLVLIIIIYLKDSVAEPEGERRRTSFIMNE